MTDETTTETLEKWCWASFWQRLKKRELISDDLDALTLRVVIPLLSPALSSFFINTEGAFGASATRMAYIWIAPPVVALCCLLSYWTKPMFQNIYYKVFCIVSPVIFGLFITFMSMGYFYFANALTGSNEPVAVYGPVVKKGYSTGRTGFNAYLTFLYNGREVTLKVPSKDYKSHKIGDIYGQTMYRGGMGYFYRWNCESIGGTH